MNDVRGDDAVYRGMDVLSRGVREKKNSLRFPSCICTI